MDNENSKEMLLKEMIKNSYDKVANEQVVNKYKESFAKHMESIEKKEDLFFKPVKIRKPFKMRLLYCLNEFVNKIRKILG